MYITDGMTKKEIACVLELTKGQVQYLLKLNHIKRIRNYKVKPDKKPRGTLCWYCRQTPLTCCWVKDLTPRDDWKVERTDTY